MFLEGSCQEHEYISGFICPQQDHQHGLHRRTARNCNLACQAFQLHPSRAHLLMSFRCQRRKRGHRRSHHLNRCILAMNHTTNKILGQMDLACFSSGKLPSPRLLIVGPLLFWVTSRRRDLQNFVFGVSTLKRWRGLLLEWLCCPFCGDYCSNPYIQKQKIYAALLHLQYFCIGACQMNFCLGRSLLFQKCTH